MASPLGEMFDHGKCPLLLLNVLVQGVSRMRCYKYHSEISFTIFMHNIPNREIHP